MSSELKPCPFCGAGARLHNLDGTLMFRCSRCNGNPGRTDTSESWARRRWNTRAQVSA